MAAGAAILEIPDSRKIALIRIRQTSGRTASATLALSSSRTGLVAAYWDMTMILLLAAVWTAYAQKLRAPARLEKPNCLDVYVRLYRTTPAAFSASFSPCA